MKIAAAAVLTALLTLGAAPRNPHLNIAPPGTIVQRAVAYLSGEAMHSMWYVVVSRKLLGRQIGKTPAYQYYLSFYAPDGDDGGKLVYQLPNAQGDLLSKVSKANGVQLYFPQQDARIVGAAELEHPGVQDVVVWDRQAGADCGTADVTIFGADARMHVQQRVHVENGCELSAKIVKHGELRAVKLTGPYYAPNAALCCPSKARASATLSYSRGEWLMKPNYFIISASLATHR